MTTSTWTSADAVVRNFRLDSPYEPIEPNRLPPSWLAPMRPRAVRLIATVLAILLTLAATALAAEPTRATEAEVNAAAPAESHQLSLQIPRWVGVGGCDGDCLEPTLRTRRPLTLPALYGSFALVQALDLYSTSEALKQGAREANPVMASMVSSPAKAIAFKAVTTAAVVFAAERTWRKSKAGAIALMVIANGATAVVAAINMRNARMLRQVR